MKRHSGPSRRAFISSAASLLASAGFVSDAFAYSAQCTPSNVPAEPTSLPPNTATPLGQIAAGKNIRIGSQLSALVDRSYGTGLYDQIYKNLLLREKMMFIENSTGWGFGVLCPDAPVNGQIVFTNKQYNLDNTWYEANDAAAFCKQNSLNAVAHALIWQGHGPAWMQQIPTSSSGTWWTDPIFLSNTNYMKQFVSAAIKQVIQLSAGDPNFFNSIFLINEFVDPFTTQYGSYCYTGGVFQPSSIACTQSVPANYITQAFLAARDANTYWSQQLRQPKSNAKFGINESGSETDQFGPGVRAAIISVVQAMKSYGLQLDVVGLECHLQPQMMNNPYEPDWTSFGAFIDQLGSMGVEVHITELDVSDYENGCWGYPQRKVDSDNLVSSYLGSFLTEALKHSSLKSVCLWDVSDRFSFYRTFDETTWFGYNNISNPKPTSNWPRCYIMPSVSNVTCSRPTIYDDQYVAKTGRQAIVDALNSAPVH